MAKLTPEQLQDAEAIEKYVRYEFEDKPADMILSLLDHIKALEEEVKDKEYAYQAYKTMYTGHSERIKEKDVHIATLEKENARYKDTLQKYADRNNWSTHDECSALEDLWVNIEEGCETQGWELAENALKGDSNQ